MIFKTRHDGFGQHAPETGFVCKRGYACVRVRACAPEGINNQWCDVDPMRLVKQVYSFSHLVSDTWH